jgi:hypothetical protein
VSAVSRLRRQLQLAEAKTARLEADGADRATIEAANRRASDLQADLRREELRLLNGGKLKF